MNDRVLTEEKILTIEDLQTDFLSLRIGEEISRLRIQRIRKVINREKQDNLAGVDYKYLIDTKDNKLLRVSSWALWKKIAAVLRQAGQIDVDLEIRHPAADEYEVKTI